MQRNRIRRREGLVFIYSHNSSWEIAVADWHCTNSKFLCFKSSKFSFFVFFNFLHFVSVYILTWFMSIMGNKSFCNPFHCVGINLLYTWKGRSHTQACVGSCLHKTSIIFFNTSIARFNLSKNYDGWLIIHVKYKYCFSTCSDLISYENDIKLRGATKLNMGKFGG